jgi:hypothetical protein
LGEAPRLPVEHSHSDQNQEIGLLALLRKLFAAAFVVYMSVIAIGILFFGGLFTWKLVTHDRAEAVFKAPSGRWEVRVEESCLLGACYKYPTVVVSEGWFSSRELQCDMHGADTTRVLFDKVKSHAWEDDDRVFSWTAGDPPVSGRIDIRSDCYDTAVFDDRQSLTTLRFKENCLIGGCVRSLSWSELRGGYVYTTPCRVTASGNVPVFTLPGNPSGQVEVVLDAGNRRAEWMSEQTGQTGQIDYEADCDAALQTRKEQPA